MPVVVIPEHRKVFFRSFIAWPRQTAPKKISASDCRSIVMRLCYALKHRARTDSRPERGTVFNIDLEPHEGWSGFVGERQD